MVAFFLFGFLCGGEDGRTPGTVHCLQVCGRAGRLAGCSIEYLGEGLPVCLLKVAPLIGIDMMVEEVSIMESWCDFRKAVRKIDVISERQLGHTMEGGL